ncbi:hypothetical protein D3Y59_03055 [Hymenobacter oligotrophus]|uniref:Uncharacterized protein n=1 Tax=Hymenobacter oligotrophus TaxID=2319843 RepID=A0A3B7RPJ2_9BACT|nr:hypothetical protein [Hymenobacter oligotrophus]AYA36127.1 hypothetical protein D3Y59_03055 [Hymenobacter oligotrophus]
MLTVQLIEAGFYEVNWPNTEVVGGVTYVRPGVRESVRVFLPTDACEVEVYAGDLQNGRLVYRGPAAEAAQLRYLANRTN